MTTSAPVTVAGLHTPTEIGAAVDRNMHEYWLSFGQHERGSVCRDLGLCWSYTGGPFLNRVMNVRLTPDTVEQRIRDVHDFFLAHKAAATWLVTPSSTPIDLSHRLRAQGGVLQERWLGMGAEPNQIDWNSASVAGVTIKRVEALPELRAWSSIVGYVYRLPGAARDMLYDYFANGGSGRNDRWHHYLAIADGEPVATASSFLGSKEAGIYLVGTLPQYQRKGLGRVLTLQAMDGALSEGYDLVVLQATPQGHYLYRSLGFQTSHTIDAVRWEPPSLRRTLHRILFNGR